MAIKSIADLTPDEENARSHNPRNVGMIVDALHEVGAARSIVIDEDGKILAGNATIEAAALAGIERVQVVDADGETIIAVRRKGLTVEEKKRLALYDNRTAELADWDSDQLLADLQGGLDLSGLFAKDELDELLKAIAEEPPEDKGPQIDRAAELQEKWGTATGQIWELGEHRLAVGDCTDRAVVEAVMQGEEAEILHADPPYGINLLPKRASLGKSKKYSPVIGDGQYFDPRPVLKLAPISILWGANHYANLLPSSPFWLVWDKQGGAKDTTFATCELAWCNDKQPARIITHIWDGWRRDSEKREDRYHPNQKPVAIIEWALSWVDGEIVVDLYTGTGPTLIACERLHRRCRAIEIEPKYCAVTIQRWVDLTGDEPRLIE